MNDKEKKAIEKIEKQILIGECEKAIGVPIYISDLKTVLNLIEKQKAEIEEKDREIIRCSRAANEYKKAVKCKECDCSICEAHINTLELSEEIEKKDKIIDLMAEDIYGYQIECNRYFKDKEEVIKYFEKKAEEDK